VFCLRDQGGVRRLEGGELGEVFEVGLELKALRMDENNNNMLQWGAIVDEEVKVVKGGIREAVRRGLVTETNYESAWDLALEYMDNTTENGEVFDKEGHYGKKDLVYGTIVDEGANACRRRCVC